MAGVSDEILPSFTIFHAMNHGTNSPPSELLVVLPPSGSADCSVTAEHEASSSPLLFICLHISTVRLDAKLPALPRPQLTKIRK